MSRIDEIVAEARAAGLRPWISIKERLARAVVREAANIEGIVLQGGTALRLAYGSPRLSADVDFVGAAVSEVLESGGPSFAKAAGEAVDCVAAWSLSRAGRLLRGKISLDLGPGRRLVLPVEAYPVPAHCVRVVEGVGAVESPVEIVADKIVASADRLAVRGTLKTTDLYDLWYLRVRLGTPPPTVDLVARKARNYGQAARGADLGAAARRVPIEDLASALAGVLPAAEIGDLSMPEVLDAAAAMMDPFRDVL